MRCQRPVKRDAIGKTDNVANEVTGKPLKAFRADALDRKNVISSHSFSLLEGLNARKRPSGGKPSVVTNQGWEEKEGEILG